VAQVAVCFSDKYKTHKYSVGRAYSCGFKLLVWCVAEGYVSGLQDAAPYRQQTAVTLSRLVPYHGPKCTDTASCKPDT